MALAQQAARRPELAPEAEAALLEANAANDDDPNIQYALAQILQQQGKTAEAERVVSGLRAARPDNERLIQLNADLLAEMGRRGEAAELYRDCVDGGPGAASCRDKLVRLLVEALERGKLVVMRDVLKRRMEVMDCDDDDA